MKKSDFKARAKCLEILKKLPQDDAVSVLQLIHALEAKLDKIKRRLQKTESEDICVECGCQEVELIIYPSTPNACKEYDMKCKACGSLRIEENLHNALLQSIRRIDDLRDGADKRLLKLRSTFARHLKDAQRGKRSKANLGLDHAIVEIDKLLSEVPKEVPHVQ